MYAQNSKIFEHSYITNVLGIEIPLHESGQLSYNFRKKVIEEQRLLQEFWFKDFAKLGNDLKNIGLFSIKKFE